MIFCLIKLKQQKLAIEKLERLTQTLNAKSSNEIDLSNIDKDSESRTENDILGVSDLLEEVNDDQGITTIVFLGNVV